MGRRFVDQELQTGCAALDIALSREQTHQFKNYYNAIHKWQSQVHLISANDNDRLISRHFLDSLTIFKSCVIDIGTQIADVGTGAGLPGIPMAIARPDLHLSLVESNRKKASFLGYVVRELNLLSRVTVHHVRAESLHQTHKRQFKIVASRAVASAANIIRIALPLVAPNGLLVLYKGLEIERELDEAEIALKELGGRIDLVVPAPVSEGDGAVHVIIRRD